MANINIIYHFTINRMEKTKIAELLQNCNVQYDLYIII